MPGVSRPITVAAAIPASRISSMYPASVCERAKCSTSRDPVRPLSQRAVSNSGVPRRAP